MTAGVVVALVAACERKAEPESAPTVAPKPVSEQPANSEDYRMPGAERIVAIGDVHGDLAATRAALRLAGAIDDKDEWIGGKLVVVQTGDQLDRGDDEPQILDLFEALERKAKAAGGRFYALNGNHEIMNVAGDFRYVTEGGLADYREAKPAGPSLARNLADVPESARGRAAAFLPGGREAKRLATRPVALVVGETAFAHGGILPGHLRRGLDKLNEGTKRWMRGESASAPPGLDDPGSPVWTRDYSDGEPSSRSCGALRLALTQLRAKRMVVGHTVQADGITSGCGGRVWRIDVGLAKHYGGKMQVLEIRGDLVRPLDATTAAPSASSSAPVLVAPTAGRKVTTGVPAAP